ncbi:MAG: hypothetical protein EBY66_01020 [Candidatus Fonsibacter lacus]|nr:hypothetical protein [Candidatus Fonsibacter lacus]
MQPLDNRPDHGPHDDRRLAGPARHADSPEPTPLDDSLQLLDQHQMVVTPAESEGLRKAPLEERPQIRLARLAQNRVAHWRDVADVSG